MGKKQEVEITRTFLSFHNSPSLFTVTWIFDAIKINPHCISKKLVFFPLKQAHLACVTRGQHLHQKPTQKSLRTPRPVVLPKQHLCALLSAFFSGLLSLCDQPTNHIILRQTLSKQCERLARDSIEIAVKAKWKNYVLWFVNEILFQYKKYFPYYIIYNIALQDAVYYSWK